jgi:hypothetical protein
MVSGHSHEVVDIAIAAGVVEQVLERDRRSKVREFGEVGPVRSWSAVSLEAHALRKSSDA